VHDLLIGARVAAARLLDELRFVPWSAHHCRFYTAEWVRVPLAALGVPGTGPRAVAESGGRYADAVARLVGINHVALEVGDVDEALAFYARFLAFELRGRRSTMAWIDAGDQFIALAVGKGGALDHVGIVVDDKEAVRRAAQEDGLPVAASGHLRIRDPWGNVLEIVDYRDVQFSKTDEVLRGMGLDDLVKSERALEELREKGLA
jgi:extradiol dioxygenase family protein